MPTLTLDEAKKRLTNMRPGDILRKKRTGEFELNNDAPQTKEGIIREKYPNLIGQPITLTEAAKKYNVPRTTLSAWVYRSKYIKPINDNYPMELDEAEVAYLSKIYHQRRTEGSKAPLLNKQGLPYQLKRPDVAKYRQRKQK